MENSEKRPAQKTGSPARAALLRGEGRRSFLGTLLCWLYGLDVPWVAWIVPRMLRRIEGGELYSLTLREIMRKYHGVEVGLYTSGAPFVPQAFPAGTKIGRFCTFHSTVRAYNANHPMNLKSTHALFYNPDLGLVDGDLLVRLPLTIGNDVLMGHNVIVLPSVRTVGDGAVIGAGAVVNEDVPPYAVVVGHPARVVRHRFKKEIITELLASRWWDKPLAELAKDLEEFRRPLDGGPLR
jgi:acetyltransferase-like isoleucine patch superfamily enzyme